MDFQWKGISYNIRYNISDFCKKKKKRQGVRNSNHKDSGIVWLLLSMDNAFEKR